MGKSETSVEELVSKIQRGELRLPEMQRRYVWRSIGVVAGSVFMLGYRKHSFARAHKLLWSLHANPRDLPTLKELQKLLLIEVMRAEDGIRKLKTELSIIKENTDNAAVSRSSYLANRIEGLRQAAYIWRCFGDAIAFIYMDKFALKHSFYNTDNTNAKQGAGFIGGKAGLANELALLDDALKHSVPAILVDLTNTIRHGDLCLMGGPDPYLIEIKVSNKLDRRGQRQKRNLEKLRTFYETDKCDGLRGFPELRREAVEEPERTYVNQINECIGEALKSGYAVRQPEDGLHYIVMTEDGPGPEQAMRSLQLKAPWVFFLNQAKSARTWAPYMPFILTIQDKDHLWAFIRGSLFVLVLIETEALCRIAREKGWEAEFDQNDELYPLRLKASGSDGSGGISDHLLTRIGLEFVSPEWVVWTSIEALERRFEAIKAEYGGPTSV